MLQDYIKQNVVGNIVVLNSFSNMPATDDQMEDLIKACGDRHVYLVNVRIPAVEQEQINQTLSKFANKYRNVKLINWYAYSQGHDDWFYDDGTHLTPEGQPEYANMIAHAIAEDFAADGGKVRAEETEKEKILAVLEECGGNRTKAAERLGISRRTIYRKLEEYGL